MPNETGSQAVPVMMPDGQELLDNSNDAPFRLEVQRQVQRRDAALLAAQPAPSAPPLTEADRNPDSFREFEEYDAAALADDDLEAEAERERSERQRANDDDDNDSLRESDSANDKGEASQDDASSPAPEISEEDAREAATQRLLAGSPEAPALPPELAFAPSPPSAPPGERAQLVGEAAAATARNRKAEVEPEKEVESKKPEPVAEPGQ